MKLADVPAALRPALAAWYCAVVSHDRVSALGERGPVIVEGPLARNAAFTTALSALLGDGRPLQRSTDALEGTARGAARLARWEDRHTRAPALDTPPAAGAALSGDLQRHADDWSARQARST